MIDDKIGDCNSNVKTTILTKEELDKGANDEIKIKQVFYDDLDD